MLSGTPSVPAFLLGDSDGCAWQTFGVITSSPFVFKRWWWAMSLANEVQPFLAVKTDYQWTLFSVNTNWYHAFWSHSFTNWHFSYLLIANVGFFVWCHLLHLFAYVLMCGVISSDNCSAATDISMQKCQIALFAIQAEVHRVQQPAHNLLPFLFSLF